MTIGRQRYFADKTRIAILRSNFLAMKSRAL
jgi:hypothetical protein